MLPARAPRWGRSKITPHAAFVDPARPLPRACSGGQPPQPRQEPASLELSHEFDYLRWLLGDASAVRAWGGRLSTLDVDVEDSADVIVRFAGGPVASVHLDILRRCPSRIGRVDGTEGSLVWDLLTAETRWLRPDHMPVQLTTPEDTRFDMYREELAHFAECVAGRATPLISGEDALETLRVVEAARTAAESGCEVQL
jgi:predicted dehydrogenase